MSISSTLPFCGRKSHLSIIGKALIFSLLLFSLQARAQLSGTYTICAGGSCGYSSITAAVSDLTSKGISGPVTFNVSAGTYTENPAITTVTGVSSTNTITFKGAGRGTSIIKGTSGSNVLSIGSSYITFDGFTFQNTSTSGSNISITTASYCSILNSNITTSTSNSTANVLCTNAGYITIKNCYITGGLYGYEVLGLASASTVSGGNMLFSNNRVTLFTSVGIFFNNTTNKAGGNNIYVNNVIDSSTGSIDILSENENGSSFSNNRLNAKVSLGLEMVSPNISSTTFPFQVINNWITGFTNYGGFFSLTSGGTNVIVEHNTIYSDSTAKPTSCLYIQNPLTSKAINVESNIIEELSSSVSSSFGAITMTGSASGYGTIDGNDVIAPGQYYGFIFGTLYKDYPSYQTAMKVNGWEANGSNMKPAYVKAPLDLHINQSKPAPIGVFCFPTDIDGDQRCKLFPTAGADESNYDKGHQTVKIYQPSKIYPGSPTTILQANKTGEPMSFHWFLNGVEVSDSVTLVTSAFKVGVNTIKLLIIDCAGRDSFQTNDTIAAPTSVPVVDFLTNFNKIKTGDIVTFTDLSSNGPTSWLWEVTPTVTGSTPNFTYVSGSATSQNPKIQFTTAGFYQVCLTATNAVGSSTKVCKSNYITVYNYNNLGNAVVTHSASGLLFDDGGQNGNYISNGGFPSILIDPCADSIFLTFSMFDVYCGNGLLQLYEGRDNKGTLLGNCNPGFTGGITHTCGTSCVPNILKPDTFKAKNTMFIQMTDGVNNGAAGFAAFWWSTPKKSKKASPSFTVSSPSICVNQPVNFINTTPIDPNDPATFLWDLDGDLTTFECVGTCPKASQTYFNFGSVKVTLIATNCAGTDSFSSTVSVKSPPAPKADFIVDNTTPTTADIAFFSPNITACVDNYKWTITKNGGTGTATFVNGTNDSSANPQVSFSDVGYYDVKLYVDNLNGTQSNTVTKLKYIDVRTAYCVPHVVTLLSDIGISEVKFNTIDNVTTPAAQEYSNFANTPSLATKVELGITYPLTVKRDSPIFNPMIRTAYIDWDQDGIFEYSEIVGVDSNSVSAAWTKKIKIPKTAKIGATIMRLAVNGSNATNAVCGLNSLGEYQDYRLYVIPYQTLPVITLKGTSGLNDTIYIENGYNYTEKGYSAFSLLNGNITSLVKVNVTTIPSIPYPGGLLYSYNVTDSGGLTAITQYRVIIFTKDKTPPVLVVATPDTIVMEVTGSPIVPFPIQSIISATDLVDGNLITNVVTNVNTIKSNVVGLYKVVYSVSDNAGNADTVYRYVKIIDTIPPVLTLKGKVLDTVALNTHYKDPGVTTSDNYYKSSKLDSLVIVSSDLDSSVIGIYHITYYLTDPSGNKAKPVTRTVYVGDKTPPVLTLLGNLSDTMEVNTIYIDPGYTVTDNVDKPASISVVKSGSFYKAFPTGKDTIANPTYSIIYTATDKAGNKSSVTRFVTAKDRIAPVIILKGSQFADVCRWANYIDSGYTLSDNYDLNSQIKVEKKGTFVTNGGTMLDGLYDLYYVATDRAGNKDSTVSRGVHVRAATDAICGSGGIAPGLALEKYISIFPNPNSGIFNININLPSDQKIRITATNILGQEIAEISNGILYQNSIKVDLSNQQSGIYFLSITCGNEVVIEKIDITK